MNTLNRWGLAAGLAAALALIGNAQAQGPAGATPSSPSGTGSSGSASGGSGSGQDPSAKPGSSSAGSSSATGGTGAGSAASGRQAATGGTGSGKEGKVDKDLQEKLEKLHASNQAEIQMAQVAKQNAQSPDVKQFAEQMETDHQRADEKLTQAAQTAGITSLQGKAFEKQQDKAKKEMEKLQSKTGAEFDKAYMSQMVEHHEDDVKAVDSARKDAKKANLTELASTLDATHTGMQGHLQHAKQLEKSLKEGAKAQGRRPSGATGARETGTGTGSSATTPPSSGAPPSEAGAQPRPGSGPGSAGGSGQGVGAGGGGGGGGAQ
jgi:putative membrane protein